jgi:hypothetical protein
LAVVSNGGSAEASIDRIYTLPFYSSALKTCEFGCYAGHLGTDYQLGVPTAPEEVVLAALAGTVLTVDSQTQAGKYIVIDHGNTHMTRYLHLQGFVAITGSSVAAGEVIGYEGHSGGPWCQDPPDCNVYASPNHLHFETKIDATPGNYSSGTAVDPHGASTFLWQDDPPNHADFAPAISAYSTSSYSEFVRGKNNKLYRRENGGGSFSLIPSVPCVRSGPGTAQWSTSQGIVLARDCSNYLRFTRWIGSGWSAWTLTHPYSCLLSAPGVANPTGDDLYVYYRGCNNLIYETVSTNGGSNWTTAVAVSGACAMSAPGATAMGSNRIDIVYRGCSSDTTFHTWKNVGGGWSHEGFAGTCTKVAPGIASWTTGTLEVFHRGCTGVPNPSGPDFEGIYRASYTGSWSGWTLFSGSCAASGIGMDAWAPDRLDAAYRGCTAPYVFKAYRTGSNPGDSWTHIIIGSWP